MELIPHYQKLKDELVDGASNLYHNTETAILIDFLTFHLHLFVSTSSSCHQKAISFVVQKELDTLGSAETKRSSSMTGKLIERYRSCSSRYAAAISSDVHSIPLMSSLHISSPILCNKKTPLFEEPHCGFKTTLSGREAKSTSLTCECNPKVSRPDRYSQRFHKQLAIFFFRIQ